MWFKKYSINLICSFNLPYKYPNIHYVGDKQAMPQEGMTSTNLSANLIVYRDTKTHGWLRLVCSNQWPEGVGGYICISLASSNLSSLCTTQMEDNLICRYIHIQRQASFYLINDYATASTSEEVKNVTIEISDTIYTWQT